MVLDVVQVAVDVTLTSDLFGLVNLVLLLCDMERGSDIFQCEVCQERALTDNRCEVLVVVGGLSGLLLIQVGALLGLDMSIVRGVGLLQNVLSSRTMLLV